ncbi:hypothetical protein [Natrinema halophilum]|uniref:DUF8159 domain-containing protein n=1 Tax=Natrinema halophilum TaxID=1699371 RepID=A0A7D5GKE2_9EURY|nr:hypothetical protein [Natrinema halophilum]QLG49130.1 hypothetical protein HYG82_09830 [Natrinema halophilum]
MERRKILLGSGATLATVLAGCSSDETGDESNQNDGSDGSLNGDGNGNGSDDSSESDNTADIPGFDRDKLKLDSEKVTVEDVNKAAKEIDVVATTTTTDPETLFAELESLGPDMKRAITDPEAFAAAVDSVAWVLEKDGAMVMSFTVDVAWATEYINGEMDQAEFMEHVRETADKSH